MKMKLTTPLHSVGMLIVSLLVITFSENVHAKELSKITGSLVKERVENALGMNLFAGQWST
jgi:hypothetical protein